MRLSYRNRAISSSIIFVDPELEIFAIYFFLMYESFFQSFFRNRALAASISFVDPELEIFSKIHIIPTGNSSIFLYFFLNWQLNLYRNYVEV